MAWGTRPPILTLNHDESFGVQRFFWAILNTPLIMRPYPPPPEAPPLVGKPLISKCEFLARTEHETLLVSDSVGPVCNLPKPKTYLERDRHPFLFKWLNMFDSMNQISHLGNGWFPYAPCMEYLPTFKFKPNVGKYTSPMDPMGLFQPTNI